MLSIDLAGEPWRLCRICGGSGFWGLRRRGLASTAAKESLGSPGIPRELYLDVHIYPYENIGVFCTMSKPLWKDNVFEQDAQNPYEKILFFEQDAQKHLCAYRVFEQDAQDPYVIRWCSNMMLIIPI